MFFGGYGANPYYFRYGELIEKHAVNFVGSTYGTRVSAINALLQANVAIDLYSASQSGRSKTVASSMSLKAKVMSTSRFMRFPAGRKLIAGAVKTKLWQLSVVIHEDAKNMNRFPSVDQREMNKIFGSYALSFSYAPCRNTGVLKRPLNIVRLKNFEMPMSGGVQFCEYYPELAECSGDGKEIVFYHNKAEMMEKALFYTAPRNDRALLKIKQAARIIAEVEYTWMNRFMPAFEILGLFRQTKSCGGNNNE